MKQIPIIYGENANSQFIKLTVAQLNHLKVRRQLVHGQKLIVSTGALWTYGLIEQLLPAPVVICEVPWQEVSRPCPRIELFLAQLEREAWKGALAQLGQLPLTAITPVYAARTQGRWSNNCRRDLAIVQNSASQSRQLRWPQLHDPCSFEEACAQLERAELALFAQPGAKPWPCQVTAQYRSVALSIGPPGGWTDSELQHLEQRAQGVGLGTTVLRSEMAAAVFCALASFWIRS